MADSVHLARWISQFVSVPIDFVLFPSSPHRRIHPKIQEFVNDKANEMTLEIAPKSMRWLALPLSALDLVCDNALRASILKKVISKSSFDLLHLLELQHAGYLLLKARITPLRSKVFITNWGSDIYWFQQFPKHRARILELLRIASHYSAECKRDVEIVSSLGFSKIIMPVIPNSGGINLEQIPYPSSRTSERRKIIIKGYTGFVGRALDAIRACEVIAGCLAEYEVMVYSASLKVRLRLLKLRLLHGIKVRIIKKRTPHAEMLGYFLQSRVYIGISLSDGISTSLLEAMATGCYPIQTGTSCASEWLTPESGSLVGQGNIDEISDAIRLALRDDSRVDHAAQVNRATIESRGSSTEISSIARSFYSQILNGHP
jgi:glycosyltransferase involved in cell wall biosynthesis